LNNATNDVTISGDGSVQTSVGWSTSDFIKVNPLTQIVINKARFIAEYDKHKIFIGGTYKDINPESQSTFTTNANTAFIKVCTFSINLKLLQVEYGSTPTVYESCYYSVFYNDKKYLI